MSISETAARIAALGAGSPVRVCDAIGAGITRSALRAACAGGLLARPAHGYVAPVLRSPDDDEAFAARCLALLDRRPHAVLSHSTASRLLQLPTAQGTSRTIHCIDPNPRHIPEVVIHRGRVPAAEIVELNGLRLTSPLRTAVDLARSLSLPEALITMDAAVRRRTIALNEHVGSPDHRRVEDHRAQMQAKAELEEIVARCARHAGADRARQAMRAASPLAESAAESRSRGHLLLAGIEPLGLQVRVSDADGRERRLDFLLAPGLAGEVDGMVKYDGPQGARHLREEKTRDLLLERVGLRTVRWTGVEVWRDPDSVVRLVGIALAQHAAARRLRAS